MRFTSVAGALLALAATATCAAAVRRHPDADFEFADADQALVTEADEAGAAGGGGNDLLLPPRLAYEAESPLCRSLLCRKHEVCLVRDGMAVCSPRPHAPRAAHPHPRRAWPALPSSVFARGGDSNAEGGGASGGGSELDDDVLYEATRDDLAPEREPPAPARCVGCGEGDGGGFLCGSDNRTYSSLCRLDLHNCVRRPAPAVRLACRGFCPCRRRDHRRGHATHEWTRRRSDVESNEVLPPAHTPTPPPSLPHRQRGTQAAARASRREEGSLRARGKGDAPTPSATDCSLDQMANRLLDWFAVLMQQSGAAPPSFAPGGLSAATSEWGERAWRDCKPEVRWMFARLDADADGRLSPDDLYALRHDERERCLRPFLATCADADGGGGGSGSGGGGVTREAWCACLRRATRPCTALAHAHSRTRPGAYVPACDAAGYYRPLQCHAALGVCWCVDAHGVELAGSRSKGRPRCPAAPPAPGPGPGSDAFVLQPPADDEDALGSGDGELRF